MRWSLVLVVVLAGCVDGGTDAPDEAPIEEAPPAADPGAAPQWRPGQAWTYRTLGYWDEPDEVTVIAVPQVDGHLMAAAAQEQLVDEVAWDRVYYGPIGTDHAPLAGGSRLLMFPLANGTTWEVHGIPVTATQATITWAQGEGPGFRVTGEAPGAAVLIEYASDVGHVTRFEIRNGGEIAQGIELVATSVAAEWVFVEESDSLVLHDVSAGPGAMAVLPEDDAVLAWAVGAEGGRAAVVAPDARAPEVLEGHGSPSYTARWLEPVEGDWQAAITAPPHGWMYLQLHALQWTAGTIG